MLCVQLWLFNFTKASHQAEWAHYITHYFSCWILYHNTWNHKEQGRLKKYTWLIWLYSWISNNLAWLSQGLSSDMSQFLTVPFLSIMKWINIIFLLTNQTMFFLRFFHSLIFLSEPWKNSYFIHLCFYC